MLSCNMLEGDLYFDSADCFDSQEATVTEEELAFDNSDFEIWLSEPQSVKERRQSFLSEMGLSQLPCKSDQSIALERINETDGAVSNSSDLCTYHEDDSVCCDRERNSEANSMIDDENTYSQSDSARSRFEFHHADEEECGSSDEVKHNMKSWWKLLLSKRKNGKSEVSKPHLGEIKSNRMKVKQNKKRCKEFTGLYMEQELKAHKGLIWSMKFSPDGSYLATGGEDGVVRVWHVTSAYASDESFALQENLSCNLKDSKPILHRKKISHSPVIIPEKILHIEESPAHEFYGHSSDVLDLAWSNSNCLLSSSKDKTVRLWQVGSEDCENVFHHASYVTCVQFNPMDENYFISGSLDGKVRIWGVSEKRVVDWVDARDVTSAVCYEPDGKGFVVGSVTGTCRFYKSSGNDLELEAEICVGKKRSSGNGITGIQFSRDRPRRVMITSEDSKVRVLDGLDVVHKFKGLPKSGSQMSASFTSTGRHIVSIGEDSHVYVWDYNEMCIPLSKHKKSVKSCERFFSEGVTAAVPWSATKTKTSGFRSCSFPATRQSEDSFSKRKLGNWFFIDGYCRGSSATWPEEKLPHWDNGEEMAEIKSNLDAWGLVIVTAGFDGSIRTFHNYGLPSWE